MKSVTKAALAASATVVFMALGLFGEEAEAEPVVSSWYGSELEGAPTASGEPYRPNEYTAAHPSLPFGTKLLVTYGGQETVVRVTDRGPYVKGRGLDLSRAAAQDIGLTTAGADAVDVRLLDGTGGYERYAPPPKPASAPVKERSSEQHVYRKDRDGENLDGVAAFLRERPYLRILGAMARYSGTSSRVCWDASMTAPTPAAGTRLPSVESTRAQLVAAVVPCSPGTRSLWHSPVWPGTQI